MVALISRILTHALLDVKAKLTSPLATARFWAHGPSGQKGQKGLDISADLAIILENSRVEREDLSKPVKVSPLSSGRD